MYELQESQQKYLQSQLLKGLDGVQGRRGVPLQDLHLVSVPHQRAADQFVQQGLLGQVRLVPAFPRTSIFSSLRLNVACAGGNGTTRNVNAPPRGGAITG